MKIGMLFALLSVLSTGGALFKSEEAFGRAMNAYQFSFQSIDGEPMPLSRFEGKVILVVNTASQCGFTSQYSGLVELWKKYKDEGLIVLAVPSNDFGGQEPGTANEIKTFCEVAFGVDFPMTEKVSVSGRDPHPFYKWAKTELGARAKPLWNFHKYVVGRDGELIDWFSSITSPNSSRLAKSIERALR
tara:strand:- start:219 stop:782 length:564 start_codon:yes stop_codon:yes gene_type:complete